MLTPLSKACWFHIPCRQNPTNTSRPLQSRPHPPATIPSNAFSPDSLLFQSFPKHRILTEVASNPYDHDGPTSEPQSTGTFSSVSYTDRSCFKSLRPHWSHIGAQLYWQKFLLILANIMVPHRSPINTSRWLMMATFSSTSYTDRSSSEVPQAMPFPLTPFYSVSPKASYTDRSSFWSLRP